MNLPPVIETPRLILRKPIVPDDAARIYAAYAHDEDVTNYLTWRPHRDVEESLRILRTRLAWWDEGREFSWVVTAREGGDVMGMISASDDDCPTRFTLGYVLARDFWGHGFMTEAASAVLDALFAAPQIARVWAVADCDNTASMRVLEKVGMQREGLLRKWSVHPAISPEPRDCWCYAAVR